MKVLTTLFAGFCAIGLQAQTETVEITKSYTISDPTTFHLQIENINGDVTVTGYDGSTVELDLEIRISEKRSGGMEEGKRELTLGEYELEDGLLLTMDAPWIERKWKDGRVYSRNYHGEARDYNYRYTFRVKVPYDLKVSASTVNRGDVQVEGVKGPLDVHNVNGHIDVLGAHDISSAATVNGDITIQYNRNQTMDAVFHTINGDIVLKLREGWNGEVTAESMQGDFFTAFDFDYLPAKVERTTEEDDGGTVYKIGQKNAVAIGSGRGPKLEFETLNGDIYLKRI